MCTNHCHQVFTQLQLTNISINIGKYVSSNRPTYRRFDAILLTYYHVDNIFRAHPMKQLSEALGYKSGGRGFDLRLLSLEFFLLT
jgi:hypothetical protein